jgi:hypothetical protein
MNATELILPVVAIGGVIYVAAKLYEGKPKFTRHDEKKLAEYAYTHWRDTVSQGHFQQLHYEAEEPGWLVDYIKRDVEGQIIPPEDVGHMYTGGWTYGYTRDERDNRNGQPIDLIIVNDYKRQASNTKPGYPVRKSRGDAIDERYRDVEAQYRSQVMQAERTAESIALMQSANNFGAGF